MSFLVSAIFWEKVIPSALFLLYLGVSFLVTYRAGYVNLGIGAQLIAAAIVSCYAAVVSGSATLGITLGFLAALILGLAPALLKHSTGMSEILTTLFLSIIAPPLAQWLLRLFPVGLQLMTPELPEKARLDCLQLSMFLSYLHFGGILCWLAAWLYLRHSRWGYMLRALTEAPAVVTSQQEVLLLFQTHVIAAACITLAATSNTYILTGYYLNGDYDATGFVAVAVGLLSVSHIGWLCLAASFIAVVQKTFTQLAADDILPQTASFVLYGGAVLFAAFILRRRRGAHE